MTKRREKLSGVRKAHLPGSGSSMRGSSVKLHKMRGEEGAVGVIGERGGPGAGP